MPELQGTLTARYTRAIDVPPAVAVGNEPFGLASARFNERIKSLLKN